VRMRGYKQLFIGGEWVPPAGTQTIEVISPHSEEVIGRVPEGRRMTWTAPSQQPAGRSTTARGRGPTLRSVPPR
jgi:acyl-CoA reductase-like NAD-dependent aldehyde dehydrogenase